MNTPRCLPVLGLPLLLAACSGGPPGSGGTVTGVSVQANPTEIGCVSAGSTVTSSVLTATVSGTGGFSHNVTWSLRPPTPVGTLSATSGASVTYTLPQGNWPLYVRVRATSSADPTEFADAMLNVRLCLGSSRPAAATGALSARTKPPASN